MKSCPARNVTIYLFIYLFSIHLFIHLLIILVLFDFLGLFFVNSSPCCVRVALPNSFVVAFIVLVFSHFVFLLVRPVKKRNSEDVRPFSLLLPSIFIFVFTFSFLLASVSSYLIPPSSLFLSIPYPSLSLCSLSFPPRPLILPFPHSLLSFILPYPTSFFPFLYPSRFLPFHPTFLHPSFSLYPPSSFPSPFPILSYFPPSLSSPCFPFSPFVFPSPLPSLTLATYKHPWQPLLPS